MPSLNFVKSTDDYHQQAGPHSATRRKLSLLFFFLGLAISIASCVGYSINYIPTTYQFGLIQMLPPLFWVGFALCLISLLEAINRDTEGILALNEILYDRHLIMDTLETWNRLEPTSPEYISQNPQLSITCNDGWMLLTQ